MERLIKVGQLLAPHGLRGEMRVWPLTDGPERFTELERVYLIEGEEPIQALYIEGVRFHKNLVIVKFQDLDTIDAVEPFRQRYIAIPEGEVRPLPPDRYYLFQLQGLQVYSLEGEFLGEIVDVYQAGGNDVYVVQAPPGVTRNKDHRFLLPAAKEFIKKVDLEAGRMEIKVIPGLL
ncbi:MAG: ribosome maturation factor RimM [Limnochordia bacterium]|jgi:16S rRNA processing protein RimM